jgi:hypothetical protein
VRSNAGELAGSLGQLLVGLEACRPRTSVDYLAAASLALAWRPRRRAARDRGRLASRPGHRGLGAHRASRPAAEIGPGGQDPHATATCCGPAARELTSQMIAAAEAAVARIEAGPASGAREQALLATTDAPRALDRRDTADGWENAGGMGRLSVPGSQWWHEAEPASGRRCARARPDASNRGGRAPILEGGVQVALALGMTARTRLQDLADRALICSNRAGRTGRKRS